MIEITGIELIDLPYKLKQFVGTIFFAQYPTTIVFAGEDEEPIIKEWVDCSQDNKSDRFFYYKINKVLLKQFIEGQMSHLDLINSSLESYVIFQDVQQEKVEKTVLVSLSAIPVKYKPAASFFFDYNDGVDIVDILDYFKLDLIDIKATTIAHVKDISTRNNSETIYIKLNKGRGVGYGTVNTEIFGRTLLNFDKLYKNIALDSILGIDRGDIYLDTKKNADYLRVVETELYDNRIAASYGFLIKPSLPYQYNLFEEESLAQKTVSRTLNLIQGSKETDSLAKEYLLHSGFTINFYKQFLDGVVKSHLNLDINWFSPFNKTDISGNIDYFKADKIMNDLDRLSSTDTKEFKVKGKFRAVHCDTGHYNFVSLNDEQYSGYFEKNIRDGIVNINFISIYEVVISRKVILEAGKKDERLIDTITAFYLDS